MVDQSNLTGPDIKAAADDLLDASAVMATWAKTLRIDNENNERREDIRFLLDRSKRYQASAYKLLKK